MRASWRTRRLAGRAPWLWILGLCGIASTGSAAERATSWQPGFTLAPYGWLAGLDGTIGSKSGDLDDGGGIGFPPRVDVSVSDELEEIGFMFYGEWRGERWTAFFDSVWANVSQNADLKLNRLLPSSDTTATFDGNVYQVGIGYRLYDWERSFLTVYGGGRYYDIEAKVEIKGGILPEKVQTSTTRSWTDAVFGGRWSFDFGKHWNGFLLADYGFGESRSVWQIFGTLGYEFSWGSIRGGYRYMNLDYDTATYKVNLSLSGPVLGAAFTF
jgi:hypothetical protein